MRIREIEAKSILRKHKRIDSWFLSCCGMNLYRGCTHNCAYCDGRTERYNVEGEFGEDIDVKVNAIEILRRELDPSRRRKPLKCGFIMLGGGVGDSYGPVEREYGLTRRALELIKAYELPVHILTKSTLIERDVDLIAEIGERSGAIVSMSFSSVDDEIYALFEPGVPSPGKRLDSLALFKARGVICGMFLMPVIPFVTDSAEQIERSVKGACNAGVDFIIFGGMTLKEGRQKDHFTVVLKKHFPDKLPAYRQIYTYSNSKWGAPSGHYMAKLNQTFFSVIKKYRIPVRIPPAVYREILCENDLVIVILEQIDYLLKGMGKSSPYGYAAYSLSRISEPLSSIAKRGGLRDISGVGVRTEQLILEILKTGGSSYLKKLLAGKDNDLRPDIY